MTLYVEVDKEFQARVKAAAKAEGRTVASWVRWHLGRALGPQERQERPQEESRSARSPALQEGQAGA